MTNYRCPKCKDLGYIITFWLRHKKVCPRCRGESYKPRPTPVSQIRPKKKCAIIMGFGTFMIYSPDNSSQDVYCPDRETFMKAFGPFLKAKF